MASENISPAFRSKNIDKTRNYVIEETNWNKLMSKKHKKICTTLNYIEHFLILGSTITGYISISVFAFLVGIPIGIIISAIGLKVCAITAAIEKYKSIIKKKKQNKRAFSAIFKLSSIEILISKALIHSVISHDEFVLINNVLKNITKWKKT